jgi:hypothetical protein
VEAFFGDVGNILSRGYIPESKENIFMKVVAYGVFSLSLLMIGLVICALLVKLVAPYW